MKRTDTAPQGAALPTLPDEPSLPSEILTVVAAILDVHPKRILTQAALDSAFARALSITVELPVPVAEEAAFQARAKLPEAPAGNEHAEYSAMLRAIAGAI